MPANVPTPPAYDFHDGLRIWQDGQIVAVIPPNFYGNLAMDLVKEMRKKLDD